MQAWQQADGQGEANEGGGDDGTGLDGKNDSEGRASDGASEQFNHSEGSSEENLVNPSEESDGDQVDSQ